jgi:hypothetical protein
LFEVNGIPLYVNRGLGTSTYRLRFGARPELTILTLRATTLPPGLVPQKELLPNAD